MIQELLDAGLRPALKGNRLVLGKLVLIRADGEETKHAAEVRSRGVDVNFWDRGTERKGNRVYGKDISGNRYMLSHMKNGQRVVTKNGAQVLQRGAYHGVDHSSAYSQQKKRRAFRPALARHDARDHGEPVRCWECRIRAADEDH